MSPGRLTGAPLLPLIQTAIIIGHAEHRPGVPGQIGHELTEFAVELAQKQ